MARRRTTRRNTGPKWHTDKQVKRRLSSGKMAQRWLHAVGSRGEIDDIVFSERYYPEPEKLKPGMKLFYLEGADEVGDFFSMMVEAASLAEAREGFGHLSSPWGKQDPIRYQQLNDATTEPGFLAWEYRRDGDPRRRRNTGPKWLKIYGAPEDEYSFVHRFIPAAEHNADRDQLLGSGMKLFYMEDDDDSYDGSFSMLIEAPSLADAKRLLNLDGIRVLRPWKQTDRTTEPGFLTWEGLRRRAKNPRRRNTGYVAAKIRVHTSRKNRR